MSARLSLREAAVEHAKTLRAEAVTHKRLSQFHRKKARECMEEFRIACERIGIPLIETNEGGGEIHGRTEPSPRDH